MHATLYACIFASVNQEHALQTAGSWTGIIGSLTLSRPGIEYRSFPYSIV